MAVTSRDWINFPNPGEWEQRADFWHNELVTDVRAIDTRTTSAESDIDDIEAIYGATGAVLRAGYHSFNVGPRTNTTTQSIAGQGSIVTYGFATTMLLTVNFTYGFSSSATSLALGLRGTYVAPFGSASGTAINFPGAALRSPNGLWRSGSIGGVVQRGASVAHQYSFTASVSAANYYIRGGIQWQILRGTV